MFLPDARAVGRAKCQIAVEFEFEGLFPLNSECNLDGLPDTEQAVAISRANEGLIRSADLLIANLTPFRSVSADAGTLFEVGFMRALDGPFSPTPTSRSTIARGWKCTAPPCASPTTPTDPT